jgi:MoxR-like ATPase
VPEQFPSCAPEATSTARTSALARRVAAEIGKVIVGQQAAVEAIFLALVCEGHVLFEGVPGTAKTLMVKALAHVVGCQFKRIQMTPDLMPSDVLGTYVFDMQSARFSLRKGPIFTSLLLADEINRAPAKTQSALLEGMEERQVTIDGVPHALPRPFMVFATQNPVEYEGTYPLPEAQLDRFLFKILIEYPTQDEEDRLLRLHHEGFNPLRLAEYGLQPVATPEDIAACSQEIQQVTVEPGIIRYISAIARRTRQVDALYLGCSPRGSVMLLRASKALAAARGRSFVIPDDVKAMALPVLRHRVILRPEAEIEGLTPDEALLSVLDTVEVPR